MTPGQVALIGALFAYIETDPLHNDRCYLDPAVVAAAQALSDEEWEQMHLFFHLHGKKLVWYEGRRRAVERRNSG